MRKKDLKEGLGDLAHAAERDHEVQMARAELYKIAKYAIQLHDMLKSVSEEEGLEGWQQAKITKAADYIGSVYHNLDYEMKFGQGEAPEMATESVNEDELPPELAQQRRDAYNQATGSDIAGALLDFTDDMLIKFFRSQGVPERTIHRRVQGTIDSLKKDPYTWGKFVDFVKRSLGDEGSAQPAPTQQNQSTDYKDQLAKKLEEKAKSKAQQKFMGMVYAAKKGEKPASKEVAKAAKGMSKKAAKDYASTKHKGKPEHVKKD